MANSREETGYQRVVIDEAPGSEGFFTTGVNSKRRGISKMYVSVRETGDSSLFTATVTLQFRVSGDDDWQDYETYTEVIRKIIEDGGSAWWRVGIKNGDYTEGTVTCGIDW